MNDESIIIINGIEYVKKSQLTMSEKVDGLEYVIIRGDRSGAFAGYLESLTDRVAILKNCRRLWYWKGAASLSGMAASGVSCPNDCKFTSPVKIKILDVIEVISTTDKAKKSIESVKAWEA
jgi:hypothetical protein